MLIARLQHEFMSVTCVSVLPMLARRKSPRFRPNWLIVISPKWRRRERERSGCIPLLASASERSVSRLTGGPAGLMTAATPTRLRPPANSPDTPTDRILSNTGLETIPRAALEPYKQTLKALLVLAADRVFALTTPKMLVLQYFSRAFLTFPINLIASAAVPSKKRQS